MLISPAGNDYNKALSKKKKLNYASIASNDHCETRSFSKQHTEFKGIADFLDKTDDEGLG